MVGKFIINFLRRIIDRYDEKNGLRKKAIFMCKNWETRNRYKLPEWRTEKGEPMCPIYKDDRCCGSCDLSVSCDHAINCNCYGFARAALGGTVKSEMMRKCSPYYKYGRMKDEDTFDWEYYYINRAKDEIKPGKYLIVKNYEALELPENIVYEMKEKKLKVGLIVEGLNENNFIKLNFRDDNCGTDFIVDVFYKGVDLHPCNNYVQAKLFCA